MEQAMIEMRNPSEDMSSCSTFSSHEKGHHPDIELQAWQTGHDTRQIRHTWLIFKLLRFCCNLPQEH